MKKIIILFALMICAFSYAQNNEFAKYTTNIELSKVKNAVKPEQKKEFYAQYLKNELVQDMENTFTYKKYSKNFLRKFADTIMNYDSTSGRLDQTEQETIKKLDQLFTLNSKSNEISENLSSLLGSFPSIVKSKDATEHTVSEEVPGKILKLFYWGGGSMTSEYYYKVENDNLESISVIPENESFYKILNKNISNKNIDFYDHNGRSYTKISKIAKKHVYTIIASIYFEDDNYSEFGKIKYTTNDFKTFTPIAIKQYTKSSRWIDIKQ